MGKTTEYSVESVEDLRSLADGTVRPTRIQVDLDELSADDNQYWSTALTKEASECGCSAAASTMIIGIVGYVGALVWLSVWGSGITVSVVVGGLFLVGVLGTAAKIASKRRALRRVASYADQLHATVERTRRRVQPPSEERVDGRQRTEVS